MRKADFEVPVPQLLAEEEIELARVVPIRTETTLTRYPFHRIAKKTVVKIKQTKRNLRGKVETTWEVRNPPGPLAYKLDTIVINRRIDEMRNRGEIRQLLKLGSLREICQEIGINPNGKATNSIKEALRENAFAGITAKLEFTGNDGTQREFEFNTTRYTVIFTGEKMPGGKRADAVYIELHPRYHEMLKHSKTRPLDYEYLKELPPSSQRFYELISFAMFGTLKHGRPNAQMLYSEFCQSAPLTRYVESKKMHSQMWKVHKPHIDAGYIKAVDFEETTDSNGLVDWLIRYTPGRKARHEFREFNTKRVDASKTIPHLEAAPRNGSQQSSFQVSKLSSKQAGKFPSKQVSLVMVDSTDERSPEDAAILEKLTSYGIDESRAARLIESDREECEIWANAWPHQNQKGMENPPAVLIRFIETKRRPLPKGYKEAVAHEERQKKHEEAQAQERAEELYFRFFEPQFREYQRVELETIRQTTPEAYAAFESWLNKNHAKSLRMVTNEKRRGELTTSIAAEFFNRKRPDLDLNLSDFAEWNEEHNTEACEPVEWYKRNYQKIHEELDQRLKEGV